jgi:phage terminase large subunit-like protein
VLLRPNFRISTMTNSPPRSGTSVPDSLLLRIFEAEENRRTRGNRLATYRPYPRQAEFHAAGASHRERLFLAGNQLGKSLAGATEMAMHAAGTYPQWWRGRRWDRPIVAWVAGVSGEATRDNPQRLLLGRPGRWGSGALPSRAIAAVSRAAGLRDLVDTVRVRHASGGESILSFKSFEKGRERWQGETLDLVWFDEEPPFEIFSEGLTRTNATGGMVYLTCTPLLGMTEVVERFLRARGPDRHVTQMTIDEAEHYTPEVRARIVAAYAPHEREARAKGIPALGSGRVFPVAEEVLTADAFAIPPHWPQIGGLDFGWDHPFAAVKLAWDRDADCVYVTNACRMRESTPVMHAAALRPWGEWLPWAWPHDGLQHSKDSGRPLADQYRAHGLKLLPEHARFAPAIDGSPGSSGIEAGLMEMLDRMQSNRLKVFCHLEEWFQEFRLYHRRDGQVVKINDDLLCATRYALMSLRFATRASSASNFARKIEYPEYGIA